MVKLKLIVKIISQAKRWEENYKQNLKLNSQKWVRLGIAMWVKHQSKQ